MKKGLSKEEYQKRANQKRERKIEAFNLMDVGKNEEVNLKRVANVLEQVWRNDMNRRGGFLTWDEKFTKPVSKNYNISICTTCMDRKEDLKQTLLTNIGDNAFYPHVEFLVLDYNSKDNLGDWIKNSMMEYIENGTLVYCRTEEPIHFDMSHSRNVAFLLASGDIVNNVDADSFTRPNFATYINKLANEQPRKAIFAKSKQLLRGRLGFFKDEFIELGGYDENQCRYYGFDDANLMNRAWELGFKIMPFRTYTGVIPKHIKHQEGNYPKAWWQTEGENRLVSYANVLAKRFKGNEGRIWGKAKVVKNFKEEIITGVQG